MRGRSNSRNAATDEKQAPIDWQVAMNSDNSKRSERNIRWSARLGSVSLGEPVVANGLVWVGTNNEEARDPAVKGDASVLMCFRERDGQFLYQYVSPRMKEGKRYDWEQSSLASSPLVQGDRLWFCNNRCEVICLDIEPLQTSQGQPRVVWKVSLRDDLGVEPHAIMIPSSAIHCSVAGYRDSIYVNTMNARYGNKVPAPNAPSFVCLQKETGKVVWQDRSPGENILDVQQGNPLMVEIAGHAQAIIGQGDGWLRSFDALNGKLLWKFDINYKSPEPKITGSRTSLRNEVNYFVGTPIFYENRIYVASGRHHDEGDGSGRLCCIDPLKRGDVSSEVADVDGKSGPNPNSALVWGYIGKGEHNLHRTLSTAAIQNGLLVLPDHRGVIHCLNAQTGQLQWTHNTRAQIFSSPLIADGKIYLGTEDGDLLVLALSPKKQILATHHFNSFIYASPVFANGVLYVTSFERLYAIKE